MKPFRILVVDDDELNLTLLSKILGLDGYDVIQALNGQEAINAVSKEMPDLAFLDIMMPDMNGFDLCRKLRAPPINANGPIIMLTAMNSDAEKQHAMEAGANEIWSKPFDLDLFRRRISELLTSTRIS